MLELLTGKRKVGLGKGALFCLHVFKLKLDKRLFSLRKINPAERSIEPQAARRKIHYLPTFLLPLFAKDSSLGNQGMNLPTILFFWIRHNLPQHGTGQRCLFMTSHRHKERQEVILYCTLPWPWHYPPFLNTAPGVCQWKLFDCAVLPFNYILPNYDLEWSEYEISRVHCILLSLT